MSHSPSRSQVDKHNRRLIAEATAKHAEVTEEHIASARRVVAAWNARIAAKAPADFFPTIGTAIASGHHRLNYWCPACQQVGNIDLRTVAGKHHARAPISVLIPRLSCKSCCPNAPLAVLLDLAPPEVKSIPTLESLLQHGVTHIRVWCGRWPHACSNQGKVAIEGLNLNQTIVEFAAKLKCTCGTVGGQAMPDWPSSKSDHVWDPVNWCYVKK